MLQPDFTEDFLCHATDKIKKGDYSTSSYKRFFAGKTQGTGSEKRIIGDTIGPFAIKYLRIKENEYETRLSRLQAYLSELIEKANAASEVTIAFRVEIPDVSAVDINELAMKLSELFFTIINQIINTTSRSKGDSIQKPNNKLEEIPSAMRTRINDKIIEILILIDSMLDLGKKIAYWQKRHTISKPYSQCPSWQELHDNYDRYNKLNIELRVLCRKYSLELLKQAITLSEQFSVDSFWRCYPMRNCRTWDTLDKIDEYKSELSNASLDIEKSLMN